MNHRKRFGVLKMMPLLATEQMSRRFQQSDMCAPNPCGMNHGLESLLC
jgi:hypothetical protein